MPTLHRTLHDHKATLRLGAALASRATHGDLIALHGDLGTGKTTLARGFIRSLTGNKTDVPSPTFTLVQTYHHNKLTIHHADLYRITCESQVEELGLDHTPDAVVLIEWPERAQYLLRQANVRVTLTAHGHGRIASIKMTDSWIPHLHDLPDPL